MKVPRSTLKKMAIVAGGVALVSASERAGRYLGDLAVESPTLQGPGATAQTPNATPAAPDYFLSRYVASPTPTPPPYSCPACGMG